MVFPLFQLVQIYILFFSYETSVRSSPEVSLEPTPVRKNVLIFHSALRPEFLVKELNLHAKWILIV